MVQSHGHERKNMPKRNRLAMGRYRILPRALTEGTHTQDIKWAKEGEWVICLGVPFGNDLDSAKWCKKKVESVRYKATHWVLRKESDSPSHVPRKFTLLALLTSNAP